MAELGKLDTLAARINEEHRAFAATFRKTVEHGIRAGQLLAAAKEQCPHGTWLPWLEQNFEGAPRTAQEYMRLYSHRDEIRAKTRDSAHLSVSGALRELATPREASEDRQLEAAAESAQEALAYLRWHWTLDESNTERVSIGQYAKQTGKPVSRIRAYVRAYELAHPSGGPRTFTEALGHDEPDDERDGEDKGE